MGGWVENCKAIVGKLSLVNVLNFICLSLSLLPPFSLSPPSFLSPFPFFLSPPSFLSLSPPSFLSLSLSFSFFTVFSITVSPHLTTHAQIVYQIFITRLKSNSCNIRDKINPNDCNLTCLANSGMSISSNNDPLILKLYSALP